MRQLLHALLAGFLFTAPAGAFELQGLGQAANAYEQAIRRNAPAQGNDKARDAALTKARAATTKPAEVAPALEQAIANGAASPAVWLELSQAWNKATPPNPQRALQSAFLAYQARYYENREDRQNAAALAALPRIADLLEKDMKQPANALLALEEALDLAPNDGALVTRVTELRRTTPIAFRNVQTNVNAAPPRSCFLFQGAITKRRDVKIEDFITVEPAAQVTVERGGESLCVVGLNYGTSYRITVKAGLPSDNRASLASDASATVRIGDRSPKVSFPGSGFIFPRAAGDGLPVQTVNVDTLVIKVLRVSDRNLVQQIRGGDYSGALTDLLNHYTLKNITEELGEEVWSGGMPVSGAKNQAHVTLFPLLQALGAKTKPGVYIVVAQSKDGDEYDWTARWLVLSDLALTSMRGVDGLSVFVRSLESAQPNPGVRVDLLARNNEILGSAETDASGHLRFPAGLMRGGGGNSPSSLLAYAEGGDFNFLNLDLAAFDLADRGVEGRATPGPLDPFLYTDRGIYRPGETIHFAGILRDDAGAVVGATPLTLKLLRPSGTLYRTELLRPNDAGGFTVSIPLASSAAQGKWTAELYADPKGKPIGQITAQVEDFVPERLKVALTPPTEALRQGATAQVEVSARFLYGPPAAGLTGTGELLIGPDPKPFPQHAGYHFGLLQDGEGGAANAGTRLVTVAMSATDAQGKGGVPITLGRLPDSTRPFCATLTLGVTEPGGRPTRAAATMKVIDKPLYVGIRSGFTGTRLEEGSEASFDVIAVDAAGQRIAKPGLRFEVIRERQRFQWFVNRAGNWDYRSTISEDLIETGSLDVAADQPTKVARKLGWGRYRLEVTDVSSGSATSARFAMGWYSDGAETDTPDQLEVTLDKPAYRPGDTAKVFVKGPFAGEATLTVLGDRVHIHRLEKLPSEGAAFELPVDQAWGAGAYVTVSAYRPYDLAKQKEPIRAIGLAYLRVDPKPRTLTVAFAAPQRALPRQQLDLPVRVTSDAPVTEAYLTLAAVDEGILQLTNFQSPDPAAHFFGKRLLGVDIRDDYGRLIEAQSGPRGQIRQGGDGLGRALPVVPFKIAVLFSGIVKLDAEGKITLPLEIPDFNGEMRLMAVAYDKTRVGSAAQPLSVRDDLVAELTLPRFLAPGDKARAMLSVHNTSPEAGAVTIELKAGGPLTLESPMLNAAYAANERRSIPITVSGTGMGFAKLHLSARLGTGPQIERSWEMAVQPSRAPDSSYIVSDVAPNATVALTPQMLAPYIPGTSSMSLTLTNRPRIDVAGLTSALMRYPYGCLEQVASTALPLLSLADNGQILGVGRAALTAAERVDAAIARILGMQRFEGNFGLWGPFGEGEDWLSAYAMEFLARAKARGYTVPDTSYQEGLGALRKVAVSGAKDPRDLAARAYAFHVLALAGAAPAGALRFFADAQGADLPTPLARGQVGAALARIGDAARAKAFFDGALAKLARERWAADYGSTLRDAAALIVLLRESGLPQDGMQTLIDRIPVRDNLVRQTHTQEQAWLVMAAESLASARGPLSLTLNGAPIQGAEDPWALTPTTADLAAGVSVQNASTGSIWQGLSVVGTPITPPPASREGLRITRKFFSRDGKPLNLDQMKQNDVFVVLLEGGADTKITHPAMISYPLPAGWEVETARLSAERLAAMPWLGELTKAKAVEGRDDRWAAAIDLTEDEPNFRFAFLLRAVTSGQFELPGAMAEDMYNPRFQARQATGRLTILPSN